MTAGDIGKLHKKGHFHETSDKEQCLKYSVVILLYLIFDGGIVGWIDWVGTVHS